MNQSDIHHHRPSPRIPANIGRVPGYEQFQRTGRGIHHIVLKTITTAVQRRCELAPNLTGVAMRYCILNWPLPNTVKQSHPISIWRCSAGYTAHVQYPLKFMYSGVLEALREYLRIG